MSLASIDVFINVAEGGIDEEGLRSLEQVTAAARRLLESQTRNTARYGADEEEIVWDYVASVNIRTE